MGALNYISRLTRDINSRIKTSVCVAFLVVILHITFIILLLNEHAENKRQIKEVFIEVHLLKPYVPSYVVSSLNLYTPQQIKTTLLEIKVPELISIDAVDENNNSDVSVINNKNNSTIFDPRLRKRLAEIQTTLSVADQDLKGWVDSSGAQIVEVGEGECIKSMSGVTTGERGTSWSLRFKCGKNESERMMDNINKDLSLRKGRNH